MWMKWVLGTTDDRVIRAWAADGGYTIVTKDAVFYQRALQVGHPPKVIWIRSGNHATRHTAALLRDHRHAILDFGNDPSESVLVLLG